MEQEEVYVSAIFGERYEPVPGKRIVTLHGIRPDIAKPIENPPGHMEVRGVLLFTVLFRNPRPGGHELKIIVRDASWSARMEIDCGPVEQARADDLTARTHKLNFVCPRGAHYLCVQVDGVDRSVLPVLTPEMAPPG